MSVLCLLLVNYYKIRSNSFCYKGKPRLKTAYELLRVSLDIEKNLNQVAREILFLSFFSIN